MGRLKIKKKETVIPFRETLAYRMMLLTGSIIVFLIALYMVIRSFSAGVSATSIAVGVVSVASAYAVFYNLEHLRDAKIPQRTLKKMKRR